MGFPDEPPPILHAPPAHGENRGRVTAGHVTENLVIDVPDLEFDLTVDLGRSPNRVENKRVPGMAHVASQTMKALFGHKVVLAS